MALTDILSDIYASLSFSEVHAEAPPEEEGEEGGDDDKGESDEKEGEEGGNEEGEGDSDKGGDDEDEKEDEEDEEEDEEEEEEPEDPFPKLQEECSKSAQCAPLKHHYDECAERVTRQHQNPDHKGPKEDCVEEFFHLSHCATQCAAPKLFRQLR